MIDQANDLRRLVMGASGAPSEEPDRESRMLLVVGGKGGVGTTTVAVNLSVAMAQRGLRVALIDGDPNHPDVQNICRLRPSHDIADVLAGRRTLGEALQAGPGGVMMLPGRWATTDLLEAPESGQQRLLDQFACQGTRFDWTVVDGGNSLHGFTRRLWQTCRDVVLVCSSEASSVLDTYATLKVAIQRAARPRVQLLVNRCVHEEEASDVHARISRSCRRFLGFDLPPCLWLPDDPAALAAGQQAMPFAASCASSDAATAMAAIAEAIDSTETGRSCEAPQTPAETDRSGNEHNLQIPFNPSVENADSEEDRSLSTQC